MQAPPVFRPQSGAFIPPHLRAEFSVAQPKSVAPPPALQPSQMRTQSKRAVAPGLRGVVMAKGFPSGLHSRTIQRKTGDKDALAEAETVTLAQGETVKFTKLIGGCLAITACFSGGGGAALHMVMDQDNVSQWNEFVGLVSAKTVSKIYLDSDMLEVKDGWRVKIKPASDETLWLESPDTTVGPKSALSLSNNLDNWSYGTGTFAEWFAEKFAIAQKHVLVSNTTVGVTHTC